MTMTGRNARNVTVKERLSSGGPVGLAGKGQKDDRKRKRGL
jgi:hypothetical protein